MTLHRTDSVPADKAKRSRTTAGAPSLMDCQYWPQWLEDSAEFDRGVEFVNAREGDLTMNCRL
jgi:hypothetical protein